MNAKNENAPQTQMTETLIREGVDGKPIGKMPDGRVILLKTNPDMPVSPGDSAELRIIVDRANYTIGCPVKILGHSALPIPQETPALVEKIDGSSGRLFLNLISLGGKSAGWRVPANMSAQLLKYHKKRFVVSFKLAEG